jgi:hypothetical protein
MPVYDIEICELDRLINYHLLGIMKNETISINSILCI